MSSLGNISAETGKILDLRHESIIAICINDVPYWSWNKIKFSHVKLPGVNGKFTLN